MHKKIAVLPGDGIGPEVVSEAIKVLNAIAKKYDHVFEYNEALIGAIAIDNTRTPLPDETLKVCNQSDAILFGAIGHPKYDNDPNAKIRPEQGLLKLRKSHGLFANIRPVKSYEILFDASPLKNKILENVDFVVFRELTGGIYFGEKGRKDNTSAYDICSYSQEEIKRIAHIAFQAASVRKKKVTLVDKANVLETSRLWREVVSTVSNSYVDVELDFLFVDNAAMQLIQNPSRFDVILTENMFGDILTDEASVLSGSMGMLPSASVGGKIALYEPIHGSFPQGAGKNIANPMATILSVAMMLDISFGLKTESFAVNQAVQKALDNQIVTSDIKPYEYHSTSEVGTFISDAIE
jgi:3-isopropylmalate dehydrogenase